RYLDNFVQSFSNLSKENQLNTILKLDDLMQSIKNERALNILSKRQLYRTILTVRINCYNAFSKASSRIIEIGVEGSGTAYQPFLLLKEGNTSMSLGKVDLDNNLLTLISSDRWL